jgi:hypothetical protein
MTPPSDMPGHTWQVHLSRAVADSLLRIQRRASQEGRGEECLAAFRHIVKRMHSDPTTLGEPLYRLPGLRLLVRTVAVRPIAVVFGVSEDHPLVFIRSAKLLTRQSGA